MPAFYEYCYDDDGVNLWACSSCGFTIAIRSGPMLWEKIRFCPSCGCEFTHSEQANSKSAKEKRNDRRTSNYTMYYQNRLPDLGRQKPQFRYSLRAISQDLEAKNEINSFFMVGEEDVSIFRCCSDVHCVIPPSDKNEPHIMVPELFSEYSETNMSRCRLIQMLNHFHGWPVWVSVERILK